MEPMKVASAYFEAWNRRDSTKIVAIFAEGGTYMDPTSGGMLAGEKISQYASALFAAFPDLTFEIVTAGPVGEDMVAAQWMMRGTHTGSLLGGPPTGRKIALPGADFITVEGDRIRSVRGYFDQKDLADQLAFQDAH
jgi:steroid delta-isomerase-like uncharacterized protein